MRTFSRIFMVLFIVFLTSCNNDDDFVDVPLGDYDNGYLVLTEGNFNDLGAEVAFISRDLSTSDQDIFNDVNNSVLGDILQSGTFYEDNLYLIVNNSDKIEVVNRYSFESVTTIQGDFTNPRYMAVSGTKGYVTTWGDSFSGDENTIEVIDLTNNQTLSSIDATASGIIERIYEFNGNIYALINGFGNGNQVQVIDPSTDTIVRTLTLDFAPDSAVALNNSLFVLCSGTRGSDFVTPAGDASVWQISANGQTAEKVIDWEEISPNLAENAREIELLNGQMITQVVDANGENNGIYRLDVNNPTNPELLFGTDGFFYDFTVQNNLIFASGSGLSASTTIYDAQGTSLGSFEVGDFPAEVLYNP